MSSLPTTQQNLLQGHRLKAVRAISHLSQSAFADSLGLSVRAYANYERGEREMPVALFRTLYAVHGIDPVWMLDGPGEQPVKAATRTIDLALADRVITGLDTDLASMGRNLSQAERLRVLKAAYALSATKGRLDVPGIKQLLEVVLRR